MSGTSDFVYNYARTLFASAQLNWAATDIRAMFVTAAYAQQLSDRFVSDIPVGAIALRDVVLTGLGVTDGGVCYGTIPEVDSVVAVAMILYANTGDDGTSALIYYTSSGAGFPMQGYDYSVSYDQSNGGYFQV